MTAIERTVRRAKQILVEEGAAWGTAVDGSMLRAAARSTRYTLTAPTAWKAASTPLEVAEQAAAYSLWRAGRELVDARGLRPVDVREAALALALRALAAEVGAA